MPHHRSSARDVCSRSPPRLMRSRGWSGAAHPSSDCDRPVRRIAGIRVHHSTRRNVDDAIERGDEGVGRHGAGEQITDAGERNPQSQVVRTWVKRVARPLRPCHTVVRCSSTASQARASRQSRITVCGETPSASAVSSTLSPPKNRSSITCARRGSCAASRSSASSRAQSSLARSGQAPATRPCPYRSADPPAETPRRV